MVPSTRFERVTPILKVSYSTKLSYEGIEIHVLIISNVFNFVNFVCIFLDAKHILANIFCIVQQNFAMNVDSQIVL